MSDTNHDFISLRILLNAYENQSLLLLSIAMTVLVVGVFLSVVPIVRFYKGVGTGLFIAGAIFFLGFISSLFFFTG